MCLKSALYFEVMVPVCRFTHRAPQGASYGNQCSFLGHTLVPGADFGAAPPLPRPHESADLSNTFKISNNSIEFIFLIPTELYGAEFLRYQTVFQLVKKFCTFFWKLGIPYYHVHKSSPLVPVLSQLFQFHTLSETHFLFSTIST
jgi:hypothetical protein